MWNSQSLLTSSHILPENSSTLSVCAARGRLQMVFYSTRATAVAVWSLVDTATMNRECEDMPVSIVRWECAHSVEGEYLPRMVSLMFSSKSCSACYLLA